MQVSCIFLLSQAPPPYVQVGRAEVSVAHLETNKEDGRKDHNSQGSLQLSTSSDDWVRVLLQVIIAIVLRPLKSAQHKHATFTNFEVTEKVVKTVLDNANHTPMENYM